MTLTQPSDHDLLVTLVQEMRDMRGDVREIKVRQDIQNGAIAEVKAAQYKTQGAQEYQRWMTATLLAVMAVGASLAGVILAIVART